MTFLRLQVIAFYCLLANLINPALSFMSIVAPTRRVIIAKFSTSRNTGCNFTWTGRERSFAIGSISKSALFSSPSSSPSPSPDESEMKKWEKMYSENGPSTAARKTPSGSSPSSSSSFTPSPTSNSSDSTRPLIKNEIRVVTFDLDNTIWKTGNVISSANDALANYLNDIGVHTPVRVEKVMGELFKENKGKYSPVLVGDLLKEMEGFSDENNDDDVDDDVDIDVDGTVKEEINKKIKSPVLLTQLRIDALIQVFSNHHKADSDSNQDFPQAEIEAFANEAFNVWTKARHDAIPSNLAQSVIECLDTIQALKTIEGRKVVIGAITDGNSDPRNVEMLKDYFDFCINAESVGISKPDRRVYDAAMLHVYSNPDLQHVFHDTGDLSANMNNQEIDCDVLFESMKNKWIHIGDDFIKDIVGAKELKMRSVWSRELVMGGTKEKNQKTMEKATSTANGENAANESRLMKELSEKKVVNMIIGSEDYLSDSIHAEFADAIVDQFKDVGRILTDWHLEGIEAGLLSNEVEEQKAKDIPISQDVQDLFTIVVPDDPIVERDQQSEVDSDTKFCVYCGTKLPKVAKFCSSCGSQQPVI